MPLHFQHLQEVCQCNRRGLKSSQQGWGKRDARRGRGQAPPTIGVKLACCAGGAPHPRATPSCEEEEDKHTAKENLMDGWKLTDPLGWAQEMFGAAELEDP